MSFKEREVEITVGTWFTYLITAITLTAIGWVVWGFIYGQA